MRRALIYLLYDPEGQADLSVLHALRAFRPVCHKIVVVSNGRLTKQAVAALEGVADKVIVRPNTGFDVGAYRAGLEYLGTLEDESVDELVFANSTFFSVRESFSDLFAQMEDSPADFWGITDHPEVSPHPHTGEGIMHAHLQTYWLVVRKRLLTSHHFAEYWASLPLPRTYEETIANFESELTQHFSTRGFKWQAAFPAADFGVANPTMEAPVALLRAGCPIVKKRLYFHGTEELLDLGVSVARVTDAALRQGITREVIADGILRRSDAAQASIALNAFYVVPENTQIQDQGDEHTSPDWSHLTHRPWKHLSQGVPLTEGPDSLLIVVPDEVRPCHGDGEIWRTSCALQSASSNLPFIANLFESEPKLGMAVPTLQFVGNTEDNLRWVAEARRARLVAKELGLDANLSSHGPICAFRGIGVYRFKAVAGFGERIRAAGGWDRLARLAGSERQLDMILDQLIADHMLREGYYAGQLTTANELQIEAPLWMVEAQSHFARYRGYSEYLHSWKTLRASLPNGHVAWAQSDWPFVYPIMELTQRRVPTLYLALNRLYTKLHIEVAARRRRG